MFNILTSYSDESRLHSSFDLSVYKIYAKQQQKRKASKDSAISSKTNAQGNEEIKYLTVRDLFSVVLVLVENKTTCLAGFFHFRV